MPRTKDQASRNVGGKSAGSATSSAPNRRDAYMGAMGSTQKSSRSAMSAADPKSKPQTSKMAPTSSPRPVGKPSPNRGNPNPETSAPERSTPAPSYRVPPKMVPGSTGSGSKLAPTKVPRPMPAAPARAVRANQAKFNRAASLGDDGPKVARFAPAKGPRPVANPNKKQRTYPGRTRYNYAV